jgi:hypothetical protein
MDGLMTICHDARKGRYIGSHWPNHVAPLLYSTVSGCGFAAVCSLPLILLSAFQFLSVSGFQLLNVVP